MLIKIAEIPRSTFYYQLAKLQEKDKNIYIKEKIENIYHNHKGRYGYRRITQELKNKGISINHKKVQRLMGVLKLKSILRTKKYKPYKGDCGKVAPNILNRNFNATTPNQKWATDITQFSIFNKKLYLSTVIDLYNGKMLIHSIFPFQ